MKFLNVEMNEKANENVDQHLHICRYCIEIHDHLEFLAVPSDEGKCFVQDCNKNGDYALPKDVQVVVEKIIKELVEDQKKALIKDLTLGKIAVMGNSDDERRNYLKDVVFSDVDVVERFFIEFEREYDFKLSDEIEMEPLRDFQHQLVTDVEIHIESMLNKKG